LVQRILFVVNEPGFFLSHRLEIAEEAKRSGLDVHVATKPGEFVAKIKALGFVHHVLPLSRSGCNPVLEIQTLLTLWKLVWELKPDVLHLVTIKPVLYGGIVARLAPVKGVVSAISGLGYVFTSQGFKSKVYRKIVHTLYWLALKKKNLRVIFQNSDDMNHFFKNGIVATSKAEIIYGSGVDLKVFSYSPEMDGIPVVSMAARLLSDKGVYEFVEAARILKNRGVKAHFQLIGDIDIGNPTSITKGDLNSWRQEKIVDLLGYREDVKTLFSNSNIVVLPSYREGFPKVLIEAAASGRAVVTTDVPGCRDAIDPKVSGLLVPVRNSEALADAIEELVVKPKLRQKFGKAGRQLAERKYSINFVVKKHLDIYKQLGIRI